jgi:uncharacterized protein YdhG (YjbR/CyaY superfamily)
MIETLSLDARENAMVKTYFTSIDEYIATCPEQSQGYVQKIREVIHAAVPKAKEKISYQIACFELDGRNLVYFAGWKSHVSMYPVPSGTKAFSKEISKYADGKGTIKFPLDKPLPLKLIRQVVKYRMTDNLGYEKSKAPSSRAPLRGATRSPKRRGGTNKKEKP